ncbi:MerR family transcriptional regulator [Motiliproteus sp. MSK22-1]|uniref:MerR family transcriptional regulator n=1 Tax=Motiliproteus sp. MSK22-1 TaxID=1897630 RepID=UPI0009768F42|nr:MerR family transcriptional regulator [Motiliproteus sp. MSK22-1]OMH38833.1 MerR family transcriptional regulator [Motiliproteus sp. MSK22-1]
MLTVSQLGKKFQISRSTILYYERENILLPARRSENGYRWYGSDQIERLERILTYRSVGVPVSELNGLLQRKDDVGSAQLLWDQFHNLEREIKKLRQQQRAILKFLDNPMVLEETMVSKERWVEIMKVSGMSDEAMHNWHRQFEKMEPDSHQEFLESLSIEDEEISRIREWSRS